MPRFPIHLLRRLPPAPWHIVRIDGALVIRDARDRDVLFIPLNSWPDTARIVADWIVALRGTPRVPSRVPA